MDLKQVDAISSERAQACSERRLDPGAQPISAQIIGRVGDFGGDQILGASPGERSANASLTFAVGWRSIDQIHTKV